MAGVERTGKQIVDLFSIVHFVLRRFNMISFE